MISRDEAELVVANDFVLLDRTGQQVGPVRRIFLDEYTGWPSFATVDLHPDASTETFVALHEADLGESTITVPYPRDVIRAAPQVVDDEALTAQEEDALFDYYGVPIDGVVPSVEHLGTVLHVDPSGDVTETPTDQIN